MFKHSINAHGSVENKKRFIDELRKLGYNGSPRPNAEVITVNQNNEPSDRWYNGTIDSWGKAAPRDFAFDLDTDFDLALAIAGMHDDNIPHIGEWIKISKGSVIDRGIDNDYARIESVDSNGKDFNVDHRPRITFGADTSLEWNNKATPEELFEYFKNKKQDTKVMSTKTSFTIGGSKWLKTAFLEELAEEVGFKRIGNDPIEKETHIFVFELDKALGYGTSHSVLPSHFILPQDYVPAKAAVKEFLKPAEPEFIEVSTGGDKYRVKVYADYVLVGSRNTLTRTQIDKLLNPNQLFEGLTIFDYPVQFANPAIQIGCTSFSAPELAAVKQAFETLNK